MLTGALKKRKGDVVGRTNYIFEMTEGQNWKNKLFEINVLRAKSLS